jgi:hypothetical protein
MANDFTFGRWQGYDATAYMQVHAGKNAQVLGMIDMNNVFTAQTPWGSADTEATALLAKAKKHDKKKFNSHMECLDALNAD